MKCYSELIKLDNFEERYQYLKLNGKLGESTFGYDRWVNQRLYQSPEWRKTRDAIIIRDSACDLAIEDRAIFGMILIHHMNPLSLKDIEYQTKKVFDPEFLICVTKRTHNAIHFGDERLLTSIPKERKLFDTCPWRQ
jgi:hypothetical protein